MRLFHETAPENVESILRNGFRDAGPFLHGSGGIYGVFVADEPPRFRANWVLLAVELDASLEDLAPYAHNERVWPPHGNHYREWCLPAEVLNACPTPIVIKKGR